MYKKLFLLMLGILLLSVPAKAADPAAPAEKTAPATNGSIILNMTMGDPANSAMGVFGDEFKKFVEEKSHGTLKINLAYGGGLGADESFQFHQVQTGKLDMALGGIGNLVPMVKPLGVLTLPYIFSSIDDVVRGTSGKPGEMLDGYAQKAGMRILAWTYHGFRHISNSKRPINDLNDIRGLRFRVPQSIAMIQTYRAFGAIPSTIPWNMTFNALKHDLVDGQCYDYSGFKAMNFAETGQKFITEIHCIYNLQPLVMSDRIFSKLSPENQQILIEAGKHIQLFSLQYQQDHTEQAKEALIKDGIQVSEINEMPWIDASKEKVWSEVAESIGGREAINAFLSVCSLPLWK